MSIITLDIANTLVAAIGQGGVDRRELSFVSETLADYNRSLWDSPYPFMNLPFGRFQFTEMHTLAHSINTGGIRNLVLLGIGGSSLGTETIYHAILNPFHNLSEDSRDNRPRYFILDNIDPHTINRVMDLIGRDKDHTVLVVISKSGETPETISQFMIFNELLKGSASMQDRIVLITDKDKGILKEIAGKEGYPVLSVPDGVGGRFSVLTPVGLFPSLLMGLDIDALMSGARDMALHIREKSSTMNMAMILAGVLYLMDKKGKHLHIMMPYCERLSAFADWFRQLEAESLGKGGCGPTPVKALGVTDQHSQLQLYIDGPKDKLVMLLYGGTETRPIPASFPYLEDLEYLQGKDLQDLFQAELAGTTLSLAEANTPNLTINIEEVSCYSLGALFFLFEMVVTYLGRLYNVNPFDQPGVELGKVYTKAIMGKKGFESEQAKMSARPPEPENTISF